MAYLPATPTPISKIAQQGVIQYHLQAANLSNGQWNVRQVMQQIDRAYQREEDQLNTTLRAKAANRYGDSDKLQNVTIPLVLEQVESAVGYQASVFLTGEPIIEVVSSPQNADQALQMNTIIAENQVRGQWKRNLLLTFRDAMKYNLAPAEVCWDRKVTAALETDVNFGGGKEGKPKEVIWTGNCINHWDLYNTAFDSRVIPADIPAKGEFVSNTTVMGRVELKQFIAELPDKMVDNLAAAYASGAAGSTTAGNFAGGAANFYIPQINPESLVNKNTSGAFDWLVWAGVTGASDNASIQYKNLYEVTTLYARIIPSDFSLKVPGENTPQVWKFIIVNHQVVIYAERQTNAHGWIPVLFMQPLEDSLRYQTKSLAQNISTLQSVSSALMNSVLASRRRAISDRGLYNPQMVTEANINSDNPSAKIPVRMSAIGKSLSEAYYPIPFNDDQSPLIIQEIGNIGSLADRISGQNKAQQGQFVKGNKTQTEFQTVMGNANTRGQVIALLIEDQFMMPLKTIIKTNILQYQSGVQIYNAQAQQNIQIDPIALRKAIMDFKVSDGLVPADKIINADTLQVFLQMALQNPNVVSGFDIPSMITYLMNMHGADLKPFQKPQPQQQYEQALGMWQQSYERTLEMIKVTSKAFTPENAAQLLTDLMKLLPPQPTPQQFGIQNGAN